VTSPAGIAQVVPAVPSFSVDDGFSYAVPPDMEVVVGSIVRIPLGGRRVRGFVTGLRSGDPAGLKPLLRVSSRVPVFDEDLLTTLRTIAIHYVAPQSVILAKAAPPNLPVQVPTGPLSELSGGPSGVLPALAAHLAAGGYDRPHFLLGRAPWTDVLAGVMRPSLQSGRSAMVVMPTVMEMREVAASLGTAMPGRIVSATSADEARDVTAAWSRAAAQPGIAVIGTREIAFWPVRDVSIAVVVGEGRKGMKEKSSPTIHAREVLRRRAAIERFGLLLAGSVPTTEVVASGIPLIRTGGTRAWPLVEVVDRSAEPPGSGFVTSRTLAAIRAVVGRGGRVFVFTHRRGYSPAFRCARCRLVRTCPRCDARTDRGPACPRCGTELTGCTRCGAASFEPLGAGAERITEVLDPMVPAGPVGSDRAVWVGTERDLPAVRGVDLAVVVDSDGLIHAPNYRAGEDALRLLARVVETVGPGSGRRAMVQTGRPDDPVISALRHGDPTKYLDGVVAERAATRLPPIGEVLVVELDRPGTADVELRELAQGRAEVFGPAPRGEHRRWMVQGSDLRPIRVGLRRLVQGWRDAGTRVRIDVDPIDL
jgi:primosomal protein N' (replication factor Y)